MPSIRQDCPPGMRQGPASHHSDTVRDPGTTTSSTGKGLHLQYFNSAACLIPTSLPLFFTESTAKYNRNQVGLKLVRKLTLSS